MNPYRMDGARNEERAQDGKQVSEAEKEQTVGMAASTNLHTDAVPIRYIKISAGTLYPQLPAPHMWAVRSRRELPL
jgi:hypothetical protein